MLNPYYAATKSLCSVFNSKVVTTAGDQCGRCCPFTIQMYGIGYSYPETTTGAGLAAGHYFFQRVSSPKLAEAKAAKHAISLALELGFGNVILSSRCLSHISKLNEPDRDRASTGVLAYDI